MGYCEINAINGVNDIALAMEKYAETFNNILEKMDNNESIDEIQLHNLKAKIKHSWFDAKMFLLDGIANHDFGYNVENQMLLTKFNSMWRDGLGDFLMTDDSNKLSIRAIIRLLEECKGILNRMSRLFSSASYDHPLNRTFGEEHITRKFLDGSDDYFNDRFPGLELFGDALSNFIKTVYDTIPNNTKINMLMLNYDRYHNMDIKEDYKDKINMFASYNTDFDIGDTRNVFTKVAIGEQDTVMSTNNAYNITIVKTLCTEYSVRSSGSLLGSEYMENKGVLKAIRYTNDNGYIVVVTPRWALRRSLLDILCSNGVIVSKYTLPIPSESSKYNTDMVMLVLKKCSVDKTEAVKTFNEFRQIVAIDTDFHEHFFHNTIGLIIDHDDLLEAISIPAKIVKFFKGSQPDIQVMMSLLRRSSAFNKAIKKESVHDIKPLLPFNNGQIGQVLASGKLDGLVVEKNTGCKHVIRGRVYKAPVQRIQYDNDNGDRLIDRITTTVKTNAVAINVFTGRGEYKTIAISNQQ